MNELEERYIITTKMPLWAREFLRAQGIPRKFSLSELTIDQKFAIVFIADLDRLRRKGSVKVSYNPKTMNQPEISLTKKGEKEAKT